MDESKTILIVGGAGYIGSHTNLVLNESGYRTLVVDNLVYGHEASVIGGQFIQADLADTDALRNIFQNHNIHAVIHFAAYAYVGESVSDPAKYYMNNVSGTLNLLSVMLEFDVKQMVFSSTCAVYGTPEYLPLDESHPTNPVNPYGWGKLMVERILIDYARAYKLKFIILRYFNAAGADLDTRIGEQHDPETHLIPLVLQSTLKTDTTFSIFGTEYPTPDGTCIRDYIHVHDLALAHLAALEYLQAGGNSDIFNLGNGNGYSVAQIINAAEVIMGKSVPAINAPPRQGDPASLVSCSDKARKTLGWSPTIPDLDKIIQSAWEWELKKQQFKI